MVDGLGRRDSSARTRCRSGIDSGWLGVNQAETSAVVRTRSRFDASRASDRQL